MLTSTAIFWVHHWPSEIELEAVGVGHPVPPSTEQKALRLLDSRATANAIYLRGQTQTSS